ncbi:Alpha/Beta hydrolase protein [Talaromyces proteolyticus]|uniref:Alpha/Beta hydrolase protein n=1 Tax=Talaromyces proteolyticus TaxID=1131652 RepID=A0AAD4L2A1_9EURO|nr:Alpha/Beta hydrolase protein [Talaromyces proteolyticus]KAH8703209.1 Alpha/Beta hydrolase protein [Talaromyces proteolyticus]
MTSPQQLDKIKDEHFDKFEILNMDYKTVKGHGIRADVLTPKSICSGPRPIITYFHGGGLVFGDSLYFPWFPLWVLQLALDQSAVIVCGNHRLLPESTGVEILEDIDDFWGWLRSKDTANWLASHYVQLDLRRILTTGDSAGGFLNIYLALTYPDQIRVSIASYPMLNQEPLPVGDGKEPSPTKKLTDYCKTRIKTGNVVSSDTTWERNGIFGDMIKEGMIPQLFSRDGSASSTHKYHLYQLKRLEHPTIYLPPGGLVILHGDNDPVVPWACSDAFVWSAKTKLQNNRGADRIRLITLKGGGHGYGTKEPSEAKSIRDAIKGDVVAWLK